MHKIYWSKGVRGRETAMVNDQRKADDYLRRLFLTIRRSPTCARQTSKSRFFAVRRLCGRARSIENTAQRNFWTDILANLAQLGTTFAVPVYVAWGVMSGNIGGIGVYATLIASSLALKEALNALGWWSSQVALLRRCLRAEGAALFSTQIRPSKRRQTAKKASDGPFSIRFDHVCPTATRRQR